MRSEEGTDLLILSQDHKTTTKKREAEGQRMNFDWRWTFEVVLEPPSSLRLRLLPSSVLLLRFTRDL